MTRCEVCRNLTGECAKCKGDKQFLELWNRYMPIKYLEPPKWWYKRYGLCEHFSKKEKRDAGERKGNQESGVRLG